MAKLTHVMKDAVIADLEKKIQIQATELAELRAQLSRKKGAQQQAAAHHAKLTPMQRAQAIARRMQCLTRVNQETGSIEARINGGWVTQE